MTLLDNIVPEDSDDFSEQEAVSAIETSSISDLQDKFVEALASIGGSPPKLNFAFRRFRGVCYWRMTLTLEDHSVRTLVYRTNWLGDYNDEV